MSYGVASTFDRHAWEDGSGTAEALPGTHRDTEVRMAKIAWLREAIAAGTYGVASEDLAQKLIGILMN